MIQIIEVAFKDYKITMINIFKEIKEKINAMYEKLGNFARKL